MVLYGLVWYGGNVVRYGGNVVRFGVVWYCVVVFVVRYGMVLCGVVK